MERLRYETATGHGEGEDPWLKVPGKIPSDVIFAALAEVRDLVERAAAAAPPTKPR